MTLFWAFLAAFHAIDYAYAGHRSSLSWLIVSAALCIIYAIDEKDRRS